MVFKVIDGQLVTIFDRVKNINSGFDLTSNKINILVDRFNDLNTNQNFGKDWEDLLASIGNQNVADYLNDLAKQGASAKASIEGVYTAIINGNTKGLSNVKSLIATFNNLDPQNQKAFANAVGQTNTNLGKYLSNVETGKAKLSGYAGQLVTATAKTVGLQIASAALNTVLSLGVTFVINTLITAISGWVNSLEEVKRKQEEAAQKAFSVSEAYKSEKDSLEDLKKEYLDIVDSTKSETDKSIELLGWKKKLIEAYKDEQDAINGVTTARETGISFFDKESYNEAIKLIAEQGSAYEDAIDKIYNNTWSKTIKGGTRDKYGNLRSRYYGEYDKLTEFGIIADSVYGSQSGYKATISFQSEEFEKKKKSIEDALSYYRSLNETNPYIGNVISDLQNIYDEMLSSIDTYGTIVETGTDALFKKYLYEFTQKTGNSINDVTEESLNDWVNNFNKYLLQYVDGNPVLQDVVNNWLSDFRNSFKVEIPDNNSVYKFVNITEELKTALDETFSNQSTLQSAFDKIKEGSSLSADEVRKLIELCPELASEFTKTADGYTIEAQKIIDGNEAIVESAKKSIQERADYLRSFINNDYNTGSINGAFEAKQYDEWKKSVESAKSELNGLELLLSMFGLTVDETKDKIKDLDDKYKELTDSTSNLVGKAKTLSSAFAEQKENGSLSTETVLSLIENGYAAALMYDKKTGAIRLNAQAYLGLANAEIEAQIIELEMAKETALKEKLNAEREIVSNLGWAYLGAAQSALEMAKAEEIINNASADVSGIDAQIKALEDYKDKLGDITNGTYGGSGGSSTDSNKEAFDAANDLRKHWIAMGKDNTGKKYTEEMYYAWLDSADGYKKYFSDLEKYQDEYNKYEEEIYKWRLEQDNKLFEQKLENNEKLIKEIKNSEYDDPLQKYDDLAKATENSLKLVQARIEELITSGSGAVQDEIDSLKKQAEELQEDLAEIEKDKLKTRVENEKTFWEHQKEAVETYYDNEIKNLEKIEDEQERINKKEELRLNLIKAQKELLDAKKNRNQLLFADGGFYYDYDQEAVQNAQENVTKAQQDITDFNNDETKRLLEEQRDNEIEYYNTIIEMLEAYINKTSPIESSDSEIFNTAMNSKYAQTVLEKKNNITKPETPVTLENVIQNMGIKYNKEVVSAGYDLLGKVMSNSLKMPFDILGAYSKMNAQNYTVNNNNNNSVYIENMPVTVPVGTTEEQVQSMIDQFASGVISTMRAKRAKL